MSETDESRKRDARKETEDQTYERFLSLKRSRSGHLAHLNRLYKEIEQLLVSSDNYDTVVECNENLKQQWCRLNDCHNKCIEAAEDDELCQLQDNYRQLKRGYDEFSEHIASWFQQRDDAVRLNVLDRPPSVTGSLNSSASSASLKAKEAKIRKAKAELMLKQLQHKQELQKQQQLLQQRAEEYDIKTEIEQAQLEESIYQEEVEQEQMIATRAINIQPETTYTITKGDITSEQRTDATEDRRPAVTTPVKIEQPSSLDPTAALWMPPTPHSTPQTDHVTRTLESVKHVIEETVNLPKPELLKFNGDPCSYCKFMSNFETNLESRVTDPRLKLSYLIQYCEGEAKKCVEDCVMLPSEAGYSRAKSILQARYGKPHLISHAYIDRLVNGPPLKTNDICGLLNLSLEMEKCEIALTQIGFVANMNNTETLRRIVKRLPMHVRTRWVDKASRIIESGYEPCFNDLLMFVQTRANVANTMYGQDLCTEFKGAASHVQGFKPTSKNVKVTGSKATVLAAQGEPTYRGETKQRHELSCVHCHGRHKLVDCEKFKHMDHDAKCDIVKSFKMCQNCLNFKHTALECRKPSACCVTGCKQKHHTLLHVDMFGGNHGNKVACTDSNDNDVSKNVHCTATNVRSQSGVCLRVLPVKVTASNGNEIETYALLDNGSDVTLCSNSLVEKLAIQGKPKQFVITTVNEKAKPLTGQEVNLSVSALDGAEEVHLDNVWTVDQLLISLDSLPNNNSLKKWPHLADIHLPEIDASQVTLLIGSNVPEVFWVQEERRGQRKEPYAIRSLLGWTIIGPTVDPRQKYHASINFQHLNDNLLQQQMEQMWKTDFTDTISATKVGMSQEDKRALTKMDLSVSLVGGHYQVGIPWRDENMTLDNNRSLAESRLRSLKKKLDKDMRLHEMYTSTVEGYIEKGYARSLNKAEIDSPSRKRYYLPHHPVQNPNKPGKVRVVFDCSAKFKGSSLNDHILQGPDLMNNLVGVIMRFREDPIAFASDIEAMFHQVKTQDDDMDALRFLWWPKGDTSLEPEEYCMTVHLFGATSSPSCTAYCLRKTAQDNKDEFNEDTICTIEQNFYVDDCLKSVENVSQAIQLASELREVLAMGGFRLTKWVSNNMDVMNSIPREERAASVVDLDLDKLPTERTLGLQWDVNSDVFIFNLKIKEKPLTRRGLLSVASSVYDPLGFVAPAILEAKLLLQKLCQRGRDWDEEISEDEAEVWKSWLNSLISLSDISIPRCLKPVNDIDQSKTEVHYFADASQLAYGAVAYLRLVDEHGHVSCSFLLGKSRLAPLKVVSIPRLELCAAVLACRLYRIIEGELNIKPTKSVFWTDSSIVVGYVRNESKRFKTFVANRLSEIHDATTPQQWRHVPSELNPADIASRGAKANDTVKMQTWLKGPNYLLENEVMAYSVFIDRHFRRGHGSKT